jgi:hypothetical protein
MVIMFHTPPTKSGKGVMFLTMEDEWGLIGVVVFSKKQSLSILEALVSLENSQPHRGCKIFCVNGQIQFKSNTKE